MPKWTRNSSASSRLCDCSRPYARSATFTKGMAFSSFEPPHGDDTSTSSEVGPADVRLREQSFRRAFGGDAALLEHVGARGNLERERRVLLDEQHGDAARVDLLDHVQHS